MTRSLTFVVSVFWFFLLIPLGALATEGALGRAITGAQVVSFAGMVPPEPGLNMQLAYLGYRGEISGDIDVPIAGLTALDLEATFDLMSLSGMYVWDTGAGKWNFASLVTVPVVHVTAHANLQLEPIGLENDDRKGGLFDAFFAPVIAGRHFDETRHLSLALYIYAP
ncbi:transporter [Microbulbifer pacificus]|uniref:transporter n=1 Tax=Microbulbifer pacificus TaxID=407164 RepID=UPI000CF4D73C|nr:transporter [Microbulbifer pacificus]